MLCYSINLLKCIKYYIGFIPSSISNPQYGVDGGTLYIFRNILPCIISISSISSFVMFVVDSMLYVIVGSTTFSYNIFCSEVGLVWHVKEVSHRM